MEFRILGPLEVLEKGRQVDLGGAKQRALLAVLLLHANEVVSTDRLVDALWEEEAPETGRKALQVYVSQLRKALGRERIVTHSTGYRLQVEEDELDLARVHRLLDEGRPGEALSLWRGPAFTDFAYERFAQSDIARLEELRLACLEERIELDLAAGRHSALVGELEALVAEHPLRERLRAQLMLALYRSGRQAEALEAFQGGRRLLTDELGLEPGQMLKDRQRAILAQDPALDLAHEAETVEQVRTETAAGTAIRRRYPLSRRGLVLAALVGAIVAAVVAVAVYTLSGDSEPEAPFAGSWASIDHDGSNQTLEVEGLAEAIRTTSPSRTTTRRRRVAVAPSPGRASARPTGPAFPQ
jgi:DNA-binding SARP family transcriptional activator